MERYGRKPGLGGQGEVTLPYGKNVREGNSAPRRKVGSSLNSGSNSGHRGRNLPYQRTRIQCLWVLLDDGDTPENLLGIWETVFTDVTEALVDLAGVAPQQTVLVYEDKIVPTGGLEGRTRREPTPRRVETISARPTNLQVKLERSLSRRISQAAFSKFLEGYGATIRKRIGALTEMRKANPMFSIVVEISLQVEVTDIEVEVFVDDLTNQAPGVSNPRATPPSPPADGGPSNGRSGR